jgi:hypothetical protein
MARTTVRTAVAHRRNRTQLDFKRTGWWDELLPPPLAGIYLMSDKRLAHFAFVIYHFAADVRVSQNHFPRSVADRRNAAGVIPWVWTKARLKLLAAENPHL